MVTQLLLFCHSRPVMDDPGIVLAENLRKRNIGTMKFEIISSAQTTESLTNRKFKYIFYRFTFLVRPIIFPYVTQKATIVSTIPVPVQRRMAKILSEYEL